MGSNLRTGIARPGWCWNPDAAKAKKKNKARLILSADKAGTFTTTLPRAYHSTPIRFRQQFICWTSFETDRVSRDIDIFLVNEWHNWKRSTTEEQNREHQERQEDKSNIYIQNYYIVKDKYGHHNW